MFDGKLDFMKFPAYYVINGLLCMLQVLHIIWTFFIMRILIDSLTLGKVIIVTKLSIIVCGCRGISFG